MSKNFNNSRNMTPLVISTHPTYCKHRRRSEIFFKFLTHLVLLHDKICLKMSKPEFGHCWIIKINFSFNSEDSLVNNKWQLQLNNYSMFFICKNSDQQHLYHKTECLFCPVNPFLQLNFNGFRMLSQEKCLFFVNSGL